MIQFFIFLFFFTLTATEELCMQTFKQPDDIDYSSIKNMGPQVFAQKLAQDTNFLDMCLQQKNIKTPLIHILVQDLNIELLKEFIIYCSYQDLKTKYHGKTPLELAQQVKENNLQTRKLAEECEDLIEMQELNTDPTFFVNAWPDWIKIILLIK